MFAKTGNVKYGFKLILYKQSILFSQIMLFSKSKFTVIYICMNFIDVCIFEHSNCE